MKTFYSLIFSVLFLGNTYGQNQNLDLLQATMKHAKATPGISNVIIDYTTANRQNSFDTIWSEDFGSGISGWVQSGTNQIWRKTGKGSSGQFAGSVPTVTINSTTKANGCIIFDADSFNTVVNGNPSNYVDLSGSITSPTINCTGKPGVVVNFQQLFRLCCVDTSSSLTLSVSNNNGVTWTYFDCRGETDINALNQTSAVPNVPTSINISAVAANQANVKLRFTFSGASTYFWQIDDIVLTESPNNDVIIQKTYLDFAYKNGGYYTITPRKLVAPITFRSAIFNNGSATQTNVVLNVDITSDSSVYNQNSNIVSSFPTISADTLQVTTPFTPSDSIAANYTVVFQLNQDQQDELPGNNTLTKTFAVSDTVYARDNGLTTNNDVGANNYVGGDVDETALANLFEFPVAEVATSISVFIDADTDNGTSISAGIWDASNSPISIAPLAESDIYDISSNADKNKWVTLPLITPFALDADGSYLAGIKNYGVSATTEVRVREDIVTEQPDGTSWALIGSTLKWGWMQALPAIRLNVQPPDISKKEITACGIKLYQNRPNPFSNGTLINYELVKNENVSLNIFDIAGKKVTSINEGNKSAGSHTIEVNTVLNPGMYFYTLKAGDYTLTKKMTVVE